MKINIINFMVTLAFLASGFYTSAQVCDPSVAPTGLTTTYTPGTGVLLEWDAIPGSVGAQFKVVLPSGASFSRQIMGFEPGQFAVPDVVLSSGNYTWRVRAACSETMPYDLTPVSESHSFTIGGGSYCPATVTDIDGNVYNTVQIGSQCWMQENLKVERYRDGSNIPTGLSTSAWSSTTSGASAVYDNVSANKAIYGLLYNGYAMTDERGLCPTGWQVPTEEVWLEMAAHLGGESTAGGHMKTTGTIEAGTGLWHAPNTGATNSSGFSALPGGYRAPWFEYINYEGWWWTSTVGDPGSHRMMGLGFNGEDIGPAEVTKEAGFSVRCIQD